MIDPELFLRAWHREHDERIAEAARLAAVAAARPQGRLYSLTRRLWTVRRGKASGARVAAPGQPVLAPVRAAGRDEPSTATRSGRWEG